MARKGESIFLRKDGRWEARYCKGYDHNHKIIYGYLYGKNYSEVKKRLHILLLSNTKRRILRRLKKITDNQKYDFLHQNYFGYLLPADSRGFLYEMKKKRLR